MAILGNNIFISLDGTTVVAGTKSNEMQTEAEAINISSATDAEWEHILSGRKRWSVTVAFLVLTDNDVLRLLDVGQAVTVRVMNRTGVMLTGQAVITQCKLTLTRGNLANGSFAIRGNGPLTAVTPSSSASS